MTAKTVTQELRRRIEKSESSLIERQWEYRQRNHAAGAWFRLRLLLALCEEAYVLTEGDLDSLLATGCPLHPVGSEFLPARSILLVSRDRRAKVMGLPRLPIRLGSGVLTLPRIAVVPFPGISMGELRRHTSGSLQDIC